MMLKHFVRCAARNFSKSTPTRVLSSNFALEKEWSARHDDLGKLGLGGDYEWISAVQKKFIGGGYASAVDVDAAVCIAEQKDQVDDVIEMLYKLRHSVKAAEKLESSEYAIVRLLLKYQPDMIVTLANDPINYGVFLNAHLACLVIDHFLKARDIPAATRIVVWMMQQEELETELLNVLSLYVCAKWSELPLGEQILALGENGEEEEEVNDDDIRTFKFPYLKNASFDEHFDLVNPHNLVGKSLMWFSRDSSSLNEDLKKSVQFLGAVLFEKLSEAAAVGSPAILPSVKSIVHERLSKIEDPSENVKRVLESIGETSADDKMLLSDLLLERLTKIQVNEEDHLCEIQKKLYAEWNERRHVLAKSQAQKVLLKVRQDEIHAELKKLDQLEEQMSFFKKRLMWEKKANENTEIDNESRERHKKKESD